MALGQAATSVEGDSWRELTESLSVASTSGGCRDVSPGFGVLGPAGATARRLLAPCL